MSDLKIRQGLAIMPRFTYNAKAYLQRQDDQKSALDGFEFKAKFPYWAQFVILRGCARKILTPSQYKGGRSLRFLEFSSLSWQCDHTEGGKNEERCLSVDITLY